MMMYPLTRSSNAITEGFFVVAAVIAVTLVASTVLPGIGLISTAYEHQAAQDKAKVDLQLSVIFAYGQPGSTTVDVWIKNTGVTSLSPAAIAQSNVFFGPTGDFQMLAFNASAPSWVYAISDEGVNSTGLLNPGETMQLTITSASPLSAGGYYFQIATYLGSTFDYTFSI